jgi:protein LTV1
MGKSGTKKKFIDKKNAVTYALMARPGADDEGGGGGPSNGSMLDGSVGGGGGGRGLGPGKDGDDSAPEPEGTQMWMRTDNNHTTRDVMAEASGDDGSVFNDSATETGTAYSGASGYSSMSNVTFIMGPHGPIPRRERLSREKRRELRELGFNPNDGYDYTRHLRQTGEGGGTMFVPTAKDHVRGVKDADGLRKSAKEEEVVYLREDVEANGMNGAAPISEKDGRLSKVREEETWTHEKIKAITDEMIYLAKDTTVANAIVARVTSAPRAGLAAAELEDMIAKMEEVELAEDQVLANLKEFADGGLGDLQDDFILQAMMGGGDDAPGVTGKREFPPIRLRYDDAEVEDELAQLEDIAEEDALEEEEEEIGQGGWYRGMGGPGSDAGTDRDVDEEDWEEGEEGEEGGKGSRRRDGYGAEARDVDDAFEAMAGGYDSEEIGELGEDDPRIFGHSEIDRFGHVMDEWRKDHGTEQYKSAADVYYEGATKETTISNKRGGRDDEYKQQYKSPADVYYDGATKPTDRDASAPRGGSRGDDDDDHDDGDNAAAANAAKVNGDGGGGGEGEKDGHAFGDDDAAYNDYGVRRPEAPKITDEDVSDARGAMIAIRKRAGLPLPEHLMREMTIGESGSSNGVPDNIARRYKTPKRNLGIFNPETPITYQLAP